MSKLTKNQRIDKLVACLLTQGRKMRELETRLSTQEKWSDYADNMLTELNHALPDPKYDAKCEANEEAINNSLDRHRERLGLNKPQLKQLDQSIFRGWADCWKFFATDEDGDAWRYREKPKIDNGDNRWSSSNTVPLLIGTGYDASNWQNSLIERDIAKELLEVEFSSELTGSELCKAMLANASKPIMCAVSDISTSKAMSLGNYDLIHDYTDEHSFMSLNQTWIYAIPINNQGEPLTQAEAGF